MEIELTSFIWRFVLSLAIGGLIGLEREKKEHHVIGFRTFALVSFLGMLLVTITQEPIAFALALAGVFALASLYYYQKTRHIAKWGITTAIMLPTAFILGALVGMGFVVEAVIAAVAAVFLLVEGKEVHSLTQKVSKDEILDLLLFVIIALVIYPKLPTHPIFVLGEPFNLQFFWTLVVLITGISFGGFILVKYVGGKALSLASFFGGVISSLAVVAVMAGKAKKQTKIIEGVIGASGAGSVVGDVLLLAVIAPLLLPFVFPLMFAFFAAFAITAMLHARNSQKFSFEQQTHPLSLKFIAEFAIGFVLVNWIISWVAIHAKGQLVLTSFAGGILSSTAVLASLGYLFNSGTVNAEEAAFALFAALASSLLAKVFVAGIATRKWGEFLKTAGIILAIGAIGMAATVILKQA